MKYGTRVLIALDQFFNAVTGGYSDETFSARAHRNHWKRTERFINWIFNDDLHCARAYIAELTHTQNAKEYRHDA